MHSDGAGVASREPAACQITVSGLRVDGGAGRDTADIHSMYLTLLVSWAEGLPLVSGGRRRTVQVAVQSEPFMFSDATVPILNASQPSRLPLPSLQGWWC